MCDAIRFPCSSVERSKGREEAGGTDRSIERGYEEMMCVCVQIGKRLLSSSGCVRFRFRSDVYIAGSSVQVRVA